MTLTQLRTVLAIVDSGLNVTLAAERIHATQSGLSKQLRQLESGLGFRLFKRRGKSLEALTAEGQEVVTRARRMIAEAEQIRALSQSLKRDNGGVLSITASPTLARSLLPGALEALAKEQPNLVVRVRHASRIDALTQLGTGETDIALVSTSTDTPPGPLAVPMLRWQRVAVVPRNHPLAELRRVSLPQLARHPLISFESMLDERSSLRRAFNSAGFNLRVSCTAQDSDLIKSYVRQGMGVGILAELSMDENDTDLVALPLAHLLPTCTTWAMPRTDRALSQPIERLLGLLAPHGDRVAVRRWLAGDRRSGPSPMTPDSVPVWQYTRPAVVPGRNSNLSPVNGNAAHN